jgi:tRNA uridine 5-carbamoylmethylation protein Kti12
MERNKKRDCQVPDEVYERMSMYFQLPTKDEGWDEVEICH